MELAKGGIDIIVKGMDSGIFISHDLYTVAQFLLMLYLRSTFQQKTTLNNF